MRKVKLFSLYDTNALFYKIGIEISEEISKWPHACFSDEQMNAQVEMLKKAKELRWPEIHFDRSESRTSSKVFPVSELRPGVGSDMKIKVNVIEYRIPFSGDINLLACKAMSNKSTKSQEWNVDPKTNELAIEYAVYGKTSKNIISEHNRYIAELMQHQSELKSECTAFNQGLENTIRQLVEKRKKEIEHQNSILSLLGLKS